MLRVTYEIVPFGQEDHPNRRVIGVQKIGLQDTFMEDGKQIGEYISALHSDALYPPLNKVVLTTNDRSTGTWPLVRKALEKHCDPEYRGDDVPSLPDGSGES